jgi:hypothetical protein
MNGIVEKLESAREKLDRGKAAFVAAAGELALEAQHATLAMTSRDLSGGGLVAMMEEELPDAFGRLHVASSARGWVDRSPEASCGSQHHSTSSSTPKVSLKGAGAWATGRAATGSHALSSSPFAGGSRSFGGAAAVSAPARGGVENSTAWRGGRHVGVSLGRVPVREEGDLCRGA